MLNERFSKDWLTSGVDPRKLSEHSIHHDQWDKEDWDYIRGEMGLLQNRIEDLCEVAPTGRPLMADLYWSFLKAEPKRKGAEDMKPSHLTNHLVMGQVEELPEWHHLRRSTEGDLFASAMACTSIEPDVATLYERQKQRQEEAQALEDKMVELAEARMEQQSLEEMLDQLEGDPSEEQQQQQADQQQAIDQLMAQIEEMGDALQQGLDGDLAGVRATMQTALDQAAKDAKDAQDAARAWGLEPGQLQKMDVAERMALAKRLSGNKKLEQIANLFGSMKELMFTEQRRKVDYLRDEIHDITLGADLDVVLPTELVKLRHPLRKLEFYRDFLERHLLQYELYGTERLAKGAIIFCEDGSGSMRGQNEIWAKAIGLSLLHLARKQKRSFLAIHFGGPGEIQQIAFNTPSDFTVDRIVKFAETFFGGGTDFMTPLGASVKHLRSEFAEQGKVDGDIVFCTDGEADVTTPFFEQFKKDQAEMDFAVWGIQIGPVRMDTLERLADGKVFTARDMTSGEDVRGVFRGV